MFTSFHPNHVFPILVVYCSSTDNFLRFPAALYHFSSSLAVFSGYLVMWRGLSNMRLCVSYCRCLIWPKLTIVSWSIGRERYSLRGGTSQVPFLWDKPQQYLSHSLSLVAVVWFFYCARLGFVLNLTIQVKFNNFILGPVWSFCGYRHHWTITY